MAKKKQVVQAASADDQRIPEDILQAFLHVIWSWGPSWRILFLSSAGVLSICFLLWTTFPEKVKTEALKRLWARYSKAAETSNSPSKGSRKGGADSVQGATHISTTADWLERYGSTHKTAKTQDAPNSWTKDVVRELVAKGLQKEIDEADGYLAEGNDFDQEKALQLYRAIIGKLSPRIRKKLDQKLLVGAERDYGEHHNGDAIGKYRALFSDYRRVDLKK